MKSPLVGDSVQRFSSSPYGDYWIFNKVWDRQIRPNDRRDGIKDTVFRAPATNDRFTRHDADKLERELKEWSNNRFIKK